MTLLRTILAELLHLFVDDGFLAAALLLWAAATAALVAILPAAAPAAAAAFAIGCAAILLVSIRRL